MLSKVEKEEETEIKDPPESYNPGGDFFVLSNVLYNEKNSEANPILST